MTLNPPNRFSKLHPLAPTERVFENHRSKPLIFAGSPMDPTEIARNAPGWLQDMSLSGIGFPGRALNAFEKQGFKTVADLARTTLPYLMKLPNFATGTCLAVAGALKAAHSAGSPPKHLPEGIEQIVGMESAVPVEAACLNLLEGIDRTLEQLRDVDKQLLLMRMGTNRAVAGWTEIAQHFGLTTVGMREREIAILKRIAKNEFWYKTFSRKMSALIASPVFAISALGLTKHDPWFDGAASQPAKVKYFLFHVTEGAVDLRLVRGMITFVTFSKTDPIVGND